MGHRVLNVAPDVEQIGVGGRRIEGQHDGAKTQLRHEAGRNRSKGDVRYGQDDHVGVRDGGARFGHHSAGIGGALLPRR